MNILLISTYELGHQPFGLASPTEWLEREGASVRCVDIAVEPLPDHLISAADLVAIYVPMHTATRLAVPVARRVGQLNPDAHLCFYGLYAPMNEDFLRKLGAESILGGEFEEGLVSLVRRLIVDTATEAVSTGQPQPEPVVSLARQNFLVPNRKDLPELERYAHLIDDGGRRKRVGYTEATRGCKHLCRHCPIVPVYGGHFRIIQRDVVLADVENLVKAGAEHITFGDPDFFNGPAHASRLVTEMHERFPETTYDVIIKVEHLVKHERHLKALKDTRCILITCAVESFDELVLTVLDKQHTREEAEHAFTTLRDLGIAVNPTFVAFTPWTSLASYIDFLETLLDLELVPNVSPIQYAIRLLIPKGSRLLELDETHEFLGEFDEEALAYNWLHPDPRMDQLQLWVAEYVQSALSRSAPRDEIFTGVLRLALEAAGRPADIPAIKIDPSIPAVPQLDEPWYCCAEPTEQQLHQVETKS